MKPAAKIKIGVQLPEVEREVRWPEMREMALTAESVGFDSLWVGDHLIYRNPGEPVTGPWECWSVLCALAAITTRVELGPFVLATGFRNPALTAKMAATLDEISNGRLILGLGAGWNPPEYDAFGIAYDHRVDRFEEAWTIIRTLLRDATIDFHGTHYSMDHAEIRPRGPRADGPPLMIGSFGDRMLWITMPHADSWNVWYADFGNTIEGLAPIMAKVDAACIACGRDPEEVERTAAVLVGMPGGTGRNSGAVSERRIPAVSGTSEEIAHQLISFGDAGISHLQLVVDPITVESIAALGPAIAHVRSLGR